MEPDPAPVDPRETLFVPNRKRFVPVYVPGPGPDGASELILYCGLEEVSFDEPELFPWAEKLIEQDSFLAGAAAGWPREPLPWPRVRELLGSLLEAGLVARGPPAKKPEVSALHLEFLQAEQARPAPAKPLFWTDGGFLREITGRDLPKGYLEAVIPVHRVAHAALDREGRQVGEANVFPEALRLKVPTEWKTCGYSGSRYHDDLPMNLTALKSMIAHWKPVLRATLLFREEFLRRYPQYPDGRWRLGDLHHFASGILALPALQLMRGVAPVRNGELDPVLSSLFRVTDGVRMVCAHMLDMYERPMEHGHPVSPRDITQAAERENQYVSTRGVCAGPQNMIDEFVATLMNGKPVDGGAAEPWAADIPLALDYALRGRQVFAVTSTLWLHMSLAYVRIREVLEPAPGLSRLSEAVARDLELLRPSRMDLAEQRDWAARFYREMYHHAQTGIRGLAPEDRAELDLAPDLLREEPLAELVSTGAAARDAAALRAVAAHLGDYLRVERAALRAVTAVQREINRLLQRPQPDSPLTGSQLAIHLLLRKGTARELPYLPDTLNRFVATAPSGPERR